MRSRVISPLLKRCRSLVVKPKIDFAQGENQCLFSYQTMIHRLSEAYIEGVIDRLMTCFHSSTAVL